MSEQTTVQTPRRRAAAESQTGRVATLIYGVLSYAVFFGTFLYAIGFVTTLVAPKTIDSGPAGPGLPSLIVDALLLGLFAVQHSVMARPAFKRWWTHFVPRPIERSTYVLLASLALILLFWLWQPLPQVLWAVGGIAGALIQAVALGGWLIVLLSTFMISHFDLFGLRQVYMNLRGESYAPPGFRTAYLYRFLRHPIMLGFLIAFWAAPVMSVGHLLFSVATTGYILIALQLEEHDLTGYFGDTYRAYRRQTPMFIPRLGRRS